MASDNIWLVIIILIPVLASYILSSNAASMFISLCLGYVLYSFDDRNALSIAHSSIIRKSPLHLNASDVSINLLLLIGPAIITLIVQKHSIAASRRALNLIPAIFSGLFCALIIVPALPIAMEDTIVRSSYWADIVRQEVGIVGIGSVVSIIFYWFTNLRSSQTKKPKSKSKS